MSLSITSYHLSHSYIYLCFSFFLPEVLNRYLGVQIFILYESRFDVGRENIYFPFIAQTLQRPQRENALLVYYYLYYNDIYLVVATLVTSYNGNSEKGEKGSVL